MIDPHPVATYVAGCAFLALAAAVSVHILFGDILRERHRIRAALVGKIRGAAPRTEVQRWSGDGPPASNGRRDEVRGRVFTVQWGGVVVEIVAARVERA